MKIEPYTENCRACLVGAIRKLPPDVDGRKDVIQALHELDYFRHGPLQRAVFVPVDTSLVDKITMLILNECTSSTVGIEEMAQVIHDASIRSLERIGKALESTIVAINRDIQSGS